MTCLLSPDDPATDAVEIENLRTQLEKNQELLVEAERDRIHLTELIKATEARFRRMANAAVDAVMMVDWKGRIVYWNTAAEKMFGYREDEVLGSDVHYLLRPTANGPQDRRAIEDYINNLKCSAVGFKMEGRAVRKDGVEVDFELTLSTAADSAEYSRLEEPAILAIIRDISERRRLVAQIENGKREWEVVFDSVADLILLTDAEGRILRCNRTAMGRLCSSKVDGIGWQDILHRQIQTLIGSEDIDPIHPGEQFFPTLTGWFDIAIYPVVGITGQAEQVYLLRDITRRKQLEDAMLASQKLASLGTLTAGIAHEINSPLQVITGLSQSLLEKHQRNELEADRLERGLRMIHRNGWRVAEIVRALRTYAHSSERNFAIHDLNTVVRDTLLLVQHQLESWSNITISTNLCPELPPMECDHEKITQALINLLTNARDALPSGGQIIISTECEPSGSMLRMIVADNGLGIPEEVYKRIFDPFFTTKPIGQGVGLGLSIVQGVVRAHSGKIEVHSKPGNGTVFTLSFPRQHTVIHTSITSQSDGISTKDGRYGDSLKELL